jgi:hypothetical protein
MLKYLQSCSSIENRNEDIQTKRRKKKLKVVNVLIPIFLFLFFFPYRNTAAIFWYGNRMYGFIRIIDTNERAYVKIPIFMRTLIFNIKEKVRMHSRILFVIISPSLPSPTTAFSKKIKINKSTTNDMGI